VERCAYCLQCRHQNSEAASCNETHLKTGPSSEEKAVHHSASWRLLASSGLRVVLHCDDAILQQERWLTRITGHEVLTTGTIPSVSCHCILCKTSIMRLLGRYMEGMSLAGLLSESTTFNCSVLRQQSQALLGQTATKHCSPVLWRRRPHTEVAAAGRNWLSAGR
jgi:hypothetical protein